MQNSFWRSLGILRMHQGDSAVPDLVCKLAITDTLTPQLDNAVDAHELLASIASLRERLIRKRRTRAMQRTQQAQQTYYAASTSKIPDVTITPEQWQIVAAILQKHISNKTVWAFGSRAKHQAKQL